MQVTLIVQRNAEYNSNAPEQIVEFDEDGPDCLESVIDEALAMLDGGSQDSAAELTNLANRLLDLAKLVD